MLNPQPINLLPWQPCQRQRHNRRVLRSGLLFLVLYLCAFSCSYGIYRWQKNHWHQRLQHQQQQLTALMPDWLHAQQLTTHLNQQQRQQQQLQQIHRWQQDFLCRLHTAQEALNEAIQWQTLRFNQQDIDVTATATNAAAFNTWLADWTRLGHLTVSRQKTLPSHAHSDALMIELSLTRAQEQI